MSVRKSFSWPDYGLGTMPAGLWKFIGYPGAVIWIVLGASSCPAVEARLEEPLIVPMPILGWAVLAVVVGIMTRPVDPEGNP